jgi:hypothetical protein
VFPQASVARYVRVTVNLLMHELLLVTSPTRLMVVAPPQLSVAVTDDVVAVGIAAAHVTVVADGQVMLGAMLSFTVMICVQVEVLPQESDTMYLRVMVKRFAQLLLLVTSPTKLTVCTPEQLSVAPTDAVFTAGTDNAQVTVVAAGQVRLGAVMSLTEIV